MTESIEVREFVKWTKKESVKVEVPETTPLPVLLKAKLVSLHVVETTEAVHGNAEVFGRN